MPRRLQMKTALRLNSSVDFALSAKMTAFRTSFPKPESQKDWFISFLPWNSVILINHGMIKHPVRHSSNLTRVNVSIIISFPSIPGRWRKAGIYLSLKKYAGENECVLIPPAYFLLNFIIFAIVCLARGTGQKISAQVQPAQYLAALEKDMEKHTISAALVYPQILVCGASSL